MAHVCARRQLHMACGARARVSLRMAWLMVMMVEGTQLVVVGTPIMLTTSSCRLVSIPRPGTGAGGGGRRHDRRAPPVVAQMSLRTVGMMAAVVELI